MSKNEQPNQMELSERELARLTADLDEAHREAYPKMRESALDLGSQLNQTFGRRGFLASAGALIAGGAVLAGAGPAAAAGRRMLSPAAASPVPTDVLVAGLAASLENLAVATYGSALSAAKAGKLGKVPAAIATFAVTAQAQHADHAAAWNSAISAAGYKKITVANPTIAKSVSAAFAKVTNVTGVAELALSLEEAAAATYLEAIGAVTSSQAVEVAATIQPVEMQHAAILNFVLGRYPVPVSFATLAAAAPISDTKGLVFAKA
ncbi:MAG: hypothetical protein JWM85_2377 [Acidimicrobiaceae bacterium]|nr:hypothetical protein [Acidimicrobiaceae bacterium]